MGDEIHQLRDENQRLRQKVAELEISLHALKSSDSAADDASDPRVAEALSFAHMVIEASSVGILLFKASGPCVLANSAAAEIVGTTVDKLLTLDFRQPESYKKADIFDAAEEALRDGRLVKREMHGTNTFGNEVWFEGLLSSCALHGEKHLLFFLYDLRERKRTEEALNASFQRLHLALEAANAGVWEWDAKTHACYWSDEVWALFNLVPNSCTPTFHAWIASIHVDDRQRVDLSIREAARAGTELNAEWRVALKDGGVRWLLSRGCPARDAEGNVSRYSGIVLDVTERRRLQESLAQADRLANMGMLAAGVAHEINNPLSYVLYNIESLADDLPKLSDVMRRMYLELSQRLGVQALAELLGEDCRMFSPAGFDDATERMREALSGVQRIKRIARGLSTFARIDRSEIMPMNVHVSIEHALTMAFNEIKYRARVVKDFGTVSNVLASEGQLAQVFLNLFINAAHAIDEGRVDANEVRVSTWQDEQSVYAEVSDTGKGISPTNQARIFQPFFTTKPPGVGSGLGLSICKNLMASLGGDITFSSEVGKGTRFRLRLPMAPRDRSTSAEERCKPTTAHVRVHGRLLIIDDEAGLRTAIRRMLGRDYDVVTVASGQEGKELLQKDDKFDVIFCDMMMPKMSGMELHVWLMQYSPKLAARVVFMTGGAFTPEAGDYLDRAGNTRVEKPFDTASFMKLTTELVLAAKAQDNVEQPTPPG